MHLRKVTSRTNASFWAALQSHDAVVKRHRRGAGVYCGIACSVNRPNAKGKKPSASDPTFARNLKTGPAVNNRLRSTLTKSRRRRNLIRMRRGTMPGPRHRSPSQLKNQVLKSGSRRRRGQRRCLSSRRPIQVRCLGLTNVTRWRRGTRRIRRAFDLKRGLPEMLLLTFTT